MTILYASLVLLVTILVNTITSLYDLTIKLFTWFSFQGIRVANIQTLETKHRKKSGDYTFLL